MQDFCGIRAAPLGRAKLTSMKDSLIVAEIGRGMIDGVLFSLDATDFWQSNLSFIPEEGPYTPDAGLVLEATGLVNRCGIAPLFTAAYSVAESGIVATIDTSPLMPVGQGVLIMRGDDVVDRADIDGPAFGIDLPPAAVIRSTFNGGCRFEFWRRRRRVQIVLGFPETLTISTAGRTFEADSLKIIPDHPCADVDLFSAAAIRMSGIRALTVNEQSVVAPAELDLDANEAQSNEA